MAIRDILVHVDDGERCGSRIDAAVNLSLAFQAELSGVYAISHPFSSNIVRGHFADEVRAQYQEMQAAEVRKSTENAEKLFREKTSHGDIVTEWHAEVGEESEVIFRHARYSDLVVAGQIASETPRRDPSDMPDRLVLGVGRPVIVIPYHGYFPSIGKRVLVAWDGGRAAARAVHDAIPFLRRAEQVKVVSVNRDTETRGGEEGPAAQLSRRLDRHDIKAEGRDIAMKGKRVGEALHTMIAEEGIDLLVMGAYGHPRWQELVLGGVTRHTFANMTTPVLMSH
jgi:nucleotide-binding universal stress UspA family protein